MQFGFMTVILLPTCFSHSCGHLQGGKSKNTNIYIYIYICVCVCVCVRERERERERGSLHS
jgi:hypothetical protein